MLYQTIYAKNSVIINLSQVMQIRPVVVDEKTFLIFQPVGICVNSYAIKTDGENVSMIDGVVVEYSDIVYATEEMERIMEVNDAR